MELQHSTGVQYLMLVGQFYHAYQRAAFALTRITGYKVLKIERKSGTYYKLGFSIKQLPQVIALCAAQGIELRKEDSRGLLYSFMGGDTSFDAALVSQPKAKAQPKPKATVAALTAAERPPKQPKNAGDPPRIYAKAVQLQYLTMQLLDGKAEMARKYRYTILPELLRLSMRMVYLADMLQTDYGQERMQRASKIAALVRTYGTSVGLLAMQKGITASQEAQVAILVEAIETEAKAHWWESRNKQKKTSSPESNDPPPWRQLRECA